MKLRKSTASPARGEGPYGLTQREKDIIAAIAVGLANRDIAVKLAVSEITVKHHLTRIFEKLGVSNRLELALYALNNSLIGDTPK